MGGSEHQFLRIAKKEKIAESEPGCERSPHCSCRTRCFRVYCAPPFVYRGGVLLCFRGCCCVFGRRVESDMPRRSLGPLPLGKKSRYSSLLQWNASRCLGAMADSLGDEPLARRMAVRPCQRLLVCAACTLKTPLPKSG